MPPGWTTEELVARAQDRDEAAFRALYDGHADPVYSWCHAFALGDEALASELAVESWITAFGSIDRLRDPGRFVEWLDAVTRITCMRVVEQRRGRPGAVSSLSDALVEVIAACPNRGLQEVAAATYDHQPASTAELAAQQGIDEDEVTSRLLRFDAWAKPQLVALLINSAENPS